MPNNEFIEPDFIDYPPSFNEFKFYADYDVNELLAGLKTDVFDANEFKGRLLVIKDLIECMGWAHEKSMDNMQANIDNLILQSNNKLMNKYCPQAANRGGNDGTVK